uniref:Odorant receptor n=1 Tax=Panagrolaimus superbus TaxID=310955 RepID=A0A914YUF3_9BILA
MTLVTVVGYYNRFSYMRVFWKFDFVLNYTVPDLELPVDVFCVIAIILYLIFQPYYCIIIAPRIGVTIIEKSLFGTTLFLNAFQKWLLETMLVNSEVCEHMRSHDSRCRAFIHYHTNRQNLTQAQNDLYTDVENGASLTYTCTLELFIGVLALLLYLPAPVQKSALEMMMASGAALIHPTPSSHLKNIFPKWISGFLWGKQKSREEHEFSEIRTPKTHWALRILFYIICFILAVLPLYIIYIVPIISVDDDHNHDHNFLLLLARLFLHFGLFAFLSFLNFYVYLNCKLQPILEEPDLIILVIASFIIAIKLLARSCLQLVTFFIFKISIYPISAILMNAVTTIFEILSFFIFIHFTQKFFYLGHKSHPESGKRWLHMFPTSFLGLYFLFYGIIGFAMYYLLNRLHLPFHSTGSDILDNALSIVHSLYPTTTLYNMTIALCYGHIVEQFHGARLYDFKRQKEDIKGSGAEVKLKLGQH